MLFFQSGNQAFVVKATTIYANNITSIDQSRANALNVPSDTSAQYSKSVGGVYTVAPTNHNRASFLFRNMVKILRGQVVFMMKIFMKPQKNGGINPSILQNSIRYVRLTRLCREDKLVDTDTRVDGDLDHALAAECHLEISSISKF